jgi:hypothetical protein
MAAAIGVKGVHHMGRTLTGGIRWQRDWAAVDFIQYGIGQFLSWASLRLLTASTMVQVEILNFKNRIQVCAIEDRNHRVRKSMIPSIYNKTICVMVAATLVGNLSLTTTKDILCRTLID